MPWRSLHRGFRVARRSGHWRFVAFNLVYDTGVLSGLVRSRFHPLRHWK
jgi:coproporphyrinogen III oxidase